MTTLFIKLCKLHDFNYQYSDDHSVWTRGREERARIREMAQADPVCAEILELFSRYWASNEWLSWAELTEQLTSYEG